MWHLIKNSDYYFYYSWENYGFSFCVTNFVNVWTSILTKDDLVKLLQLKNPLIEVEKETFISIYLEMLNDPELEAQCQSNENNIIFTARARPRNILFRIEFKLNLGDSKQFFNYITLPLLKSLDSLKKSEQSLVELLLKKDREIEEYKLEGGALFLKHLKTPPFNLSQHKEKYNIDEVPVEEIVKKGNLEGKTLKSEIKEEPSHSAQFENSEKSMKTRTDNWKLEINTSPTKLQKTRKRMLNL